MHSRILDWVNRPVSIAPLVAFRVVFGAVMFVATLRFWAKGWIDTLYVLPEFHFHYYGFSWVPQPSALGLYVLFGLMAAAALGILLGAFYRLSATLFFLAFTWVELLDAANYLNHYYFVSLVSFCLIWLPAHLRFSLDALCWPNLHALYVGRWALALPMFQLGVVYGFAGLAKLNHDWLLMAQPLATWLPAQHHLPMIGSWLAEPWVAILFSWVGAAYDLLIVGLLLWARTRILAYALVVVFHLLTAWFFPIGMFPWLMIGLTLVFFSPAWHERWMSWVKSQLSRIGWPSLNSSPGKPSVEEIPTASNGQVRGGGLLLLSLFLAWQTLWPLRAWLYPGNVFWTEEAYRFSWRVMLMEKGGHVTYYVTDPATGRTGEAPHETFLTPNQQKMLSTQPDFLLQVAHKIAHDYRALGIADPEVRVKCFVSLNRRKPRLLINPDVDLAQKQDGFGHKPWILPFDPTRALPAQAAQTPTP